MIGTALAIGAGVGALAGAIGGASDKTSTSQLKVGASGALENAAATGVGTDYATLRGYTDAGPGQSDVAAGTTASRDLAAMLGDYSKTGGMPGAGDITAGGNLASGLFQGQRMSLKQNFMDQETQNAQNAAISGRGLNDPVLRNKLAQEQTRQQMQLDANQGSLSQQLAMALPGQRLNYSAQRADVLQGLASQAMSNRQALLGIGQGIQTNERNFRLATGVQTNTQQGSLAQGISGGLAGLGAGMSAAKGFTSMLGSTGGTGPTGGGGPSLGAYPSAPAGGNIFGVGNGYGGGGGGGNPFASPSASTFSLGGSGGSDNGFFGRTTVGGRK